MFYNGTETKEGRRERYASQTDQLLFFRPSAGKLPWGDDEGDRRCLALKERLWNAMEAAYERGYRHFICGMAQGCDLYFCELALALRQLHGDVTVEAAIPCPSQAEGWPAEQRLRWQPAGGGLRL